MPKFIRVLHVDDKPEIAELTATYLERQDEHLTVETATSAASGLDKLTDETDCVVSDYEMPGMNGIELLESIREEYPRLPFILYTGRGSEEVASDAISAGVTDYLQKSTGSGQYELLANRIENAVSRARTQQQLRAQRQRLERLHEATRELMSAETPTEIAERASAAEEILDLPLNGVHYYDSDRDGLVPVAVSQRVRDILGEPPVIGPDEGIAWKAYETGETQIHSDVRDAPEVLNPDTPVRSEFHLPLGEHGVLTIASTTPDDFTEADITSASILAANVTEALDSVEREQERKRREAALSALHDATRELMDAQDKETVANRAVETARTVLDQQINGMWLYEQDAHVLRPVAMTDEAKELVGEQPTYTEGENLSWQTFEDGTLRVYDDVRTEPERLNSDTPIRSEIIVPINEYGAMNFGATESANFSATDISLAHILGKTVEAALARAEREQKLRRQRAKLKRRNERLDKFTRVVSHDLRNPLQVAASRVDLAQEDSDSVHLDGAADALDRMDTLITDLLTIARAGTEVQQTEPVSLSRATKDCWTNVKTADATLQVEASHVVHADPSRLKQLLENLVRNAVEHGGDSVTVTVGELADGFSVADDGPGIPPDERDNVFEMGHSTTENGTGFGLSIVQDIVEAHGWTVAITEGADGGARFEITDVDVTVG
jgi:signal transduction histidine kinase/CheY-like chemotaxis protein